MSLEADGMNTMWYIRMCRADQHERTGNFKALAMLARACEGFLLARGRLPVLLNAVRGFDTADPRIDYQYARSPDPEFAAFMRANASKYPPLKYRESWQAACTQEKLISKQDIRVDLPPRRGRSRPTISPDVPAASARPSNEKESTMSDTAVEEKTSATAPTERKPNMNTVRLQGRLGKEPEMHEFENGQKVVNLSVAVNRSYKDKTGQWKSKATFVPVSVHGPSAREVSLKLKTGNEVYIEGRLRQDTWKDKEGATKSMLRVDAFKLEPIVREKSKSAGAELEK